MDISRIDRGRESVLGRKFIIIENKGNATGIQYWNLKFEIQKAMIDIGIDQVRMIMFSNLFLSFMMPNTQVKSARDKNRICPKYSVSGP